MSIKSLKARSHDLSEPMFQLNVIQITSREAGEIPFSKKLKESGLFPLKTSGLEILQINMGYMCNQVCKHCHVDAGPDRKEIMTVETLQHCLEVIQKYDIRTVDLTGGAPEMNPNFLWFVEELGKLGVHIMDRCNLTILVANKKYKQLPEVFARLGVEVISSLPHYTSKRTNNQRGDGVFEDSIDALQLLNSVGYGREGTGLELNLVFNPTGAFLPGDQGELEKLYKERLLADFGVVFNKLFVITNLPIARFLDYLIETDNYADYMAKLINAYNPVAAANVMCRNTLSVGWDGYLYDCDFNQMLDLKIKGGSTHISDFNIDAINSREIIVDQHCYGCTAGAGSSCGGATT